MKKKTFFKLLIITVSFTLWTQITNAQSDFWKQANGPCGGIVKSLAINSSDHIFAGTWGSGIFRSTDNGETWTEINTGLTNTHIQATIVNSSDQIFAGTWDGGIFRSTDNGDTWMEINTGLTDPNVVALAINSIGHIFAGTNSGGVFKSIDNGDTWTEINTGLTNTYVRSLAINSSDHIFVSTSNIFRSVDNGDNWTQISTCLKNVYIMSLSINSSNHIFAGTNGHYDNGGIFRSTDNGENWTQINTGLTNNYVAALAINSSGYVFAGTDGGVFRSMDNGDRWTEINTGLGNTFIKSLAINSSDYIFAGTYGGVYRSTDNGDTWTVLPFASSTSYHIRSMAINSSGHVFAGTFDHGIFRSTDDGENWAQINIGLTDFNVISLAINACDYIFAGTFHGIFRSTDNGDTWTEISTGLTDPDVITIAINSSDYIFIGVAYQGVFLSVDNGDSWTEINSGLTNLSVIDFAINSSGYIFAGTYGSSVFRSTESTTYYFPIPDIISITDVLNDQGRQVRLTWAKSILDGIESDSTIIEYSVWRRIDPISESTSSLRIQKNPKNETHSLSFDLYKKSGEPLLASDASLPPGDWDFIQTVHAIGSETYNIVVPTLADSTIANGMHWSVFTVIAHTDNPLVFFVSEPDSGYSLDNLAPHVPEELLACVLGTNIKLTWEEVSDEDINYYAIYRSTECSFDPGSIEPYATTIDTFFIDTEIEVGTEYYYRISALDFSGNESEFSEESNATIVGLKAEGAIPKSYALFQNYPNPFNPKTTIHYQLPKSGYVNLAIYNNRGQLLETLVNEYKYSGYYSVVWDASKVGSGIYLYRISAGGYSDVKKCVVVK